MGKIVYAELDKITFDKIKKSRTTNGMIDDNKFFKGLKEGDSVIFSCNRRKIEAVLKKINIYDNICEYLKVNAHIGMLEVNSSNPIDFLNVINEKKVKIYEVDYYSYGNDDNSGSGGSGGGGGRRIDNIVDRELDDFISSLFGEDIDDYD